VSLGIFCGHIQVFGMLPAEAGLTHAINAGAVELQTALARDFSLELPATLAFDYPTVSALSKYILERKGEEEANQSTAPLTQTEPVPEEAHSDAVRIASTVARGSAVLVRSSIGLFFIRGSFCLYAEGRRVRLS
jgi:hypothetical protein